MEARASAPDRTIEPSPLARARDARPGILGLTAAAVVLGVYSIGSHRALDYDGSVTVGAFVRHGRLLDVFRTVYNFNNHPYFSFVEHIVWDAGGHSEAWLRVLPIACAAATVGLLAAWMAGRKGLLAGAAAGAVLAANPMFADLARSVRGYSMMTLGCVVATGLLVDARDNRSTMTRARSLAYVVALGVAIGTQFYAVLVLAAHVATLLADRRLDASWRRRLEAVAVVGVLPYAAMLRPLLSVARARHGVFQPRFPIDTARALLGQQPVAVVLLLVLVAVALRGAELHAALPAAAVVAGALLAIWLVLHPLDFYPRFLVWLVPVTAVAAAAAVARVPRLAPLVAIAVVVMVASQWSTWTTDPIASRAAANLVEAARATGQRPCAAAYSGEVVLGYTAKPRAVFTPKQVAGCDLLIADDDTPRAAASALGCNFEHARTLAGRTPMTVFTDAKRARPRACAG